MHITPRPLGLYLHIPFCRQKCAYCDFYSLSGQDARMDDYVDALCAHSDGRPRPPPPAIRSTPSILGAELPVSWVPSA